jgi:hypothetical protein
MQLTAKLQNILPLQTGTSKNGPWKKQEMIVETVGPYPRKVCFVIWGDRMKENILVPGNFMTIHFEAESREYNGKWYTELKVFKLEMTDKGIIQGKTELSPGQTELLPHDIGGLPFYHIDGDESNMRMQLLEYLKLIEDFEIID